MIGRNRVVITGIGVLAANGIGKDAFWNSLLAGESGIGPITQFDASDLPCQIAGEIKNFNPLDFIEPALKPKRMGRFSQLSIAATQLALKDAGLTACDLQENTIPIVMGVSTSDFSTILDKPHAYSTPALIPHAPVSSVAAILRLNCELITLSNACTSGLDAIALGANILRTGKAETAIAGGADSSITMKSFEFLCRGNMLPTEMNASAKQASRPFDLRRSGGVLAEGSGILVMETEASALARGAKIYAEILGSGTRSDFSTMRNSHALTHAMQSALDNSCVCIDQIDYINAHAPSDPYIDLMETEAIKATFQEHAYKLAVGSLKGATGNPLGAGGSLQCISTALSIHYGCLPSTVNYEITDPDCDLDYIFKEYRNQCVEHAMINSRGISGNTSSIIFKAYK